MVRKRLHHVLTKRISQISWILEKGFLNLRSKMGNWSKQQKEEEEKKERNKIRREKLSDFCFNLTNTFIGSFVVGAALLFLQDEGVKWDLIPWALFIGVAAAFIFTLLGIKFLK